MGHGKMATVKGQHAELLCFPHIAAQCSPLRLLLAPSRISDRSHVYQTSN
jgi:hypothetical protein